MKITLFGTQPYDRESFDRIRDTYGFDICYHRSHLNANNVALAQGSDAVCIFVNDTADAGTIRQLAGMGVKLIALRCAGFNNVDLNAAARYGIPVVRVPAYSPHAVAEHAVALMLALNRKIHRAYWRTRDGNFSLHGLMGFDMYGKTAGIVGTGRIARELIRILKGFGMEVVANDLFPDPQYAAEAGIAYVPLDELYARADIVSLHCPLTDRTRYMIGDAAISRMKPGVILINTGRGQLIHTEALIDGLKEKKIGAAGLDVYEEEAGYFYEDTSDRIMDDDVLARLLSFNNVIVTSHQGFFTREAVDNIARTTMQNIIFRNRVPRGSSTVAPALMTLAGVLKAPSGIAVMAVIICLAMAWASNLAGLSYAVGAFFAGIAVSNSDYAEDADRYIEPVGDTLFVPVFFVGIGLQTTGVDDTKMIVFIAIMTVLGVITKVVGCGLGGRMAGFGGASALMIGAGMVPRGEMALITAQIGFNEHVLGSEYYSTIIFIISLVTLVAPLLLKLTIRKVPGVGAAAAGAAGAEQ